MLHLEMDVRGLVRNTELYQNSGGSVQVHSGFDYVRGRKVVIKTLRCANVTEVNTTLEEGLTHIKLEHPNICQIYDCFLEEDKGEFQVVLVIEFQETDLFKEIETRRKTERFWSEKELLEMMKTLVRVFAFLQSKGSCHRDIKPQNIFISSSGVLKVGDFGSASRNLDELEKESTLVGTPLYLSPALRAGYLKKIIGFHVSRVTHNMFKSDVFSLGLTFLHMALLKPPKELATLDGLEEKRLQVLQQVPYSRAVTDIIAKALEIEEDDRPDFLQLQDLIGKRAKPLIDFQSLLRRLNERTKNCDLTECRELLTSLLDFRSLSEQVFLTCVNCSREQSVCAAILLACGKAHGFCSNSCSRQFGSECPHCKSYTVPDRCFFCAEVLGHDQMALPCSSARKVCSRSCFEANSVDGRCPLCGDAHSARRATRSACVVCGASGTAQFCPHAYCGDCLRARVLRCLEFGCTRVDCSLCETVIPREQITSILGRPL